MGRRKQKKTELAELYYCLKEHGVIAQDSGSNQLNLLYNQFGLTVGKDNTINGVSTAQLEHLKKQMEHQIQKNGLIASLKDG